MICHRWISFIGLLCLAAVWAGCGTPPEDNYKCTADEIRRNDKLLISLLDIIDSKVNNQEFTVREDGIISLPHIGAVQAAGKTFAVLEQEVARMYVEKNYYPKITVIVKAGERFYTVDGEVRSPDRKLYVGDTTVVRAIASSGGFTDFAKRSQIEITRVTGQKQVVDWKKAQRDPRYDLRICPGDYIFVPRSL